MAIVRGPGGQIVYTSDNGQSPYGPIIQGPPTDPYMGTPGGKTPTPQQPQDMPGTGVHLDPTTGQWVDMQGRPANTGVNGPPPTHQDPTTGQWVVDDTPQVQTQTDDGTGRTSRLGVPKTPNASQMPAPATDPSKAITDAMAALANSPLTQPWTVPFNYQQFKGPTYQAPTVADFYANDPGLQARLQLGQQAIERSAAARGTLLNAGTVQAENEYAQDYGSNEFNNYFNRNLTNFQTAYNSGLTDWTTNYNKALTEYQNAYNIFTGNQNNAFNKLSALYGGGQTASAQLASAGLGTTQLNTNTQQNAATGIGNAAGQGANALAAGTVGSANAWTSALTNIANNTMANLYNSSYNKG